MNDESGETNEKKTSKFDAAAAAAKRIFHFIPIANMNLFKVTCVSFFFFLFPSVSVRLSVYVQSHCRYNTFENENVTFHLFFAKLTTL